MSEMLRRIQGMSTLEGSSERNASLDSDTSESSNEPVHDEVPFFDEESNDKLLRRLLEKGNVVAVHLPRNTIDFLIEELGCDIGVAEITGRIGRLWKEDNDLVYRRRFATSSSSIIEEG
jgi:hypothetical protein